jgi:asparagine synthase (glutamine-hydrolysing)
VPVGLFLSSGLDSGAIAALAGKTQAGIRSFTLAFPGTKYDEAPLAKRVAERCGTQHTEIPLDGAAVLARLDEAVATLDQPTMDGINTYFVSWAAREAGLKVALSGLGGDEAFAGYSTFENTAKLRRLRRFSRLMPRAARMALSPLLASVLATRMPPDAAKKVAASWADPNKLPHPYFFARLLFPPGQLETLVEPRFRPSTIGADGVTLEPTWLGWLDRIAGEAGKLAPLPATSWMEMRSYMVSTLLRDTDCVSMARSLEVRVPLLDTSLLEFICALPDEARYRQGTQKALLVKSLGDLLPQEIVGLQKKTFTLPWDEWLRGPLRPRIEKSFTELAPALHPHLHRAGVRAVWDAFLSGKASWSRPWSLYVLNEWCRNHLTA